MIKTVYKLFLKVNQAIAKRVEDFGAQYIPFGIFGVLNHPIYYFIWKYLSSQSYENIWLRATATLLCIPLIFKNHLPQQLRFWLPTYWYITLLFCLPFFFTFMLLKNHATDVWLMSTSIVLIWLMLLVDWLSFVILLTLGMLLAWISYRYTSSSFFVEKNLSGLLAQYIGSLAVVLIFAHNKEQIRRERLHAMSMVAESMAHELRTPLASLHICASNLKRFIPKLMKAYVIAEASQLPIEKFRDSQLASIKEIPDLIENETKASSTFIDMLLMNANPKTEEVTAEVFGITECVNEALQRYPFTDEERNIIKWQPTIDFKVKGKQLLVIHVLFNLIKNALYYIAKRGESEISIQIEKTINDNRLYFKDTGTGISKNDLAHIFNRFYSKTHHGSGIGLTFCRMAMESLGGQIYCESVEGSYTKFILIFPS